MGWRHIPITHHCGSFSGLSSEPTGWDGDYLISMLLNSSKVVPSPPCGMVTLFQGQSRLVHQTLLVLSPPGGMETQATQDNAKTQQNGSKPTGWDGDLFLISLISVGSRVPSPLCGMETYEVLHPESLFRQPF